MFDTSNHLDVSKFIDLTFLIIVLSAWFSFIRFTLPLTLTHALTYPTIDGVVQSLVGKFPCSPFR